MDFDFNDDQISLRDAVAKAVKLEPGMSIAYSGQFEFLERANERLKLVVPATLLIIFFLLYLTFGRLDEAVLIMLTLPFALRRERVDEEADIVPLPRKHPTLDPMLALKYRSISIPKEYRVTMLKARCMTPSCMKPLVSSCHGWNP